MADLNDIVTGIRDEIYKKILVCQPQERGTGELSFSYWQASKGPIAEAIGHPRTFGVRLAGAVPKWCGNNGQRYDLTYEIRIGYPPRDWDLTMISDFGVVRSAINATGGASTVTGCGFRYVPMEAPTFEPSPNDDWIWMVFNVAAVVSTV